MQMNLYYLKNGLCGQVIIFLLVNKFMNMVNSKKKCRKKIIQMIQEPFLFKFISKFHIK